MDLKTRAVSRFPPGTYVLVCRDGRRKPWKVVRSKHADVRNHMFGHAIWDLTNAIEFLASMTPPGFKFRGMVRKPIIGEWYFNGCGAVECVSETTGHYPILWKVD